MTGYEITQGVFGIRHDSGEGEGSHSRSKGQSQGHKMVVNDGVM